VLWSAAPERAGAAARLRPCSRREDRPGAANIGLIDLTARYVLDAGYHVVVEGILYADRYGDMLARLRADHRRPTHLPALERWPVPLAIPGTARG
jgi:hypothetical protein